MAEAVKKPNADEVYQGLTGTQKCAILMMLIGEDEAAEIMGNLSPKEVQVLGSAMYSVQGLGQDTVNLVLDEFLAIIKAQTSLGKHFLDPHHCEPSFANLAGHPLTS